MNRLKEVRESLGLSQVQVAARAGVCISTLVKMEKGGRVHRRSMGRVAQALRIPIAELFDEGPDGNPAPPLAPGS